MGRKMTPLRALKKLLQGKNPFEPMTTTVYSPLYRNRRVYRHSRKAGSNVGKSPTKPRR